MKVGIKKEVIISLDHNERDLLHEFLGHQSRSHVADVLGESVEDRRTIEIDEFLDRLYQEL